MCTNQELYVFLKANLNSVLFEDMNSIIPGYSNKKCDDYMALLNEFGYAFILEAESKTGKKIIFTDDLTIKNSM